MSRASSRLPLLLLVLVFVAGAGYLAWRMLDTPPAEDPVTPLVVAPSSDLPAAPVMELRPIDRDRPPPEPEAPAGATVTGRVVTAELRAVTEGIVELRKGSPLNLPGSGSLERLGFQTEIDPLGYFAFTDVPPMDDLVVHLSAGSFAVTQHGPFAARPEQLLDLGDLIVRPGLMIRGSVTDARGAPIAGAQVDLHDIVLRNLTSVTVPEPIGTQLTDDEGRFEFQHVPHSPFSLATRAQGFARAVHEHGTVIDAATPVLDVSIALVEVTPLAGRVFDKQTGAPLPGLELVAHPFSPEHGRGLTTSDSEGRFRFEDLSPARYNVWADPVGYGRGGLVVDAESWSENLELALLPGGRLMGSVQKPDGTPVRSFDVQVMRHGTKRSPGSPVGPHQRVRDTDGAFSCEDLEPGWYSVEVWAKGYALTRTDDQIVRVKRSSTVGGMNVTMQVGAGLVGQVLDDLGEPVAGARVSLHSNRMSEVAFLRESDVQPIWMGFTHTDREGWYQLNEVTSNTYQLQVDHSDHPVVRVNDVVARAGVLLELQPIELPRSGTLQGTVVDGAGAPQIEVSVHVSSATMARRKVRTDGRGRYTMRRVPPGEYLIVAVPTKPKLSDIQGIGQAEIARALAQHDGRLELVVLGPGQTLEHTVIID